MDLLESIRSFGTSFSTMGWETEVLSHVYNPLDYAWAPHALYLERFGQKTPRRVLFLGINPGPFGMAQTGVPFGDIELVRDWMGIEAPVQTPKDESPDRPILGFDSTRREVSGSRLWGWARERWGAAEAFFDECFVWNYCPLMFLDEPGRRNRTPDKLLKADRERIFPRCDDMLLELVEHFSFEYAIGVGAFAERRLRSVLGDREGTTVGRVLHPSPASPAANKGWVERAEAELTELGVWDFSES